MAKLSNLRPQGSGSIVEDNLNSNSTTNALAASQGVIINNRLTANEDNISQLQTDISFKADLVNGLIPANQLPGFVDDVLEFDNISSFPLTGASGILYVAIDTNLVYRWSGSTYSLTSASLALGETSNTAYRGDRGKVAYEHSQFSGNPHGSTTADIEDSLNKRYVTDNEKSILSNTSGTNTGDETQLSIKQKVGNADSTNDGVLISGDWINFNNKLSQVTTILAANGVYDFKDLTPGNIYFVSGDITLRGYADNTTNTDKGYYFYNTKVNSTVVITIQWLQGTGSSGTFVLRDGSNNTSFGTSAFNSSITASINYSMFQGEQLILKAEGANQLFVFRNTNVKTLRVGTSFSVQTNTSYYLYTTNNTFALDITNISNTAFIEIVNPYTGGAFTLVTITGTGFSAKDELGFTIGGGGPIALYTGQRLIVTKFSSSSVTVYLMCLTLNY